jgi:hypothetical protein
MATPLPAGLTWRKSSFSSDNGVCVEIAYLPDGRIAVRDSKNPAGGHLTFAGSAWRAATR